jgi:hypothetical protein
MEEGEMNLVEAPWEAEAGEYDEKKRRPTAQAARVSCSTRA